MEFIPIVQLFVLLGYFFYNMHYRLPKQERIFGLKTVEKIYTKGSAFIVYPFRVIHLAVPETEEDESVRIMVSVAKKRFKKAVDRNRIKRLMRECYRLNKNTLQQILSQNNVSVYLAFQYIADDILPFEEMNKRMIRALNRLEAVYRIEGDERDENAS